MGRSEAGKTEKGVSQVKILKWVVNEGLCEEETFGQRAEGSQRTGIAKWLSGGRAYVAMEQKVQRPWGKDAYENQRISVYLMDLTGLATSTFVLWASEKSVKLTLGADTLVNPFLPT